MSVGVRISRTLGSSEAGVIGPPLIISSNSHISVLKLSSSMLCSLATRRSGSYLSFWWIVPKLRRSEIPMEGLNVHFIYFWSRWLWNVSWFHCLIGSCRSLFPLAKLFPLSQRICFTGPLRSIYLLKACRNESVSRLCMISMCSARTAKQIYIAPYCLTRLQPSLTWHGSKKSTQIAVKPGCQLLRDLWENRPSFVSRKRCNVSDS